MNKPLLLLLSLIFYCCGNNASNKPDKNISKDSAFLSRKNDARKLYPYDTILSGGYSIVYKTEDSLQYLFLKKDSIIKEISSSSIATAQKELGYVQVDFTHYFLLLHSFDPGTVDFFELIEKETGDMILSGFYIDADKEKEFLLYGSLAPSNNEEIMVLYDIRKEKKKIYNYPAGISCVPRESCIKIKSLSDHEINISYMTDKGLKEKIFTR